jgi:hypothetical protein
MKRAAFIFAVAAAFACAWTLAFAESPDGGATITVNVADGGDTTIEVVRGELKVRAAGQETRVRAGQGAHVRRGQAPKKISLLPAPSALKPADGTRLSQLDVALVWEPVSGARAYHLTVVTEPGSGATVFDGQQMASRMTVHLPAGSYTWFVRAIDHDGLEGRETARHKLVIDTTPPKLKAGPPRWQ